MLAAVAVGAWPELAAAAELVGEIDRDVEPEPTAKDAYDGAYARYRELFECLRPLYR